MNGLTDPEVLQHAALLAQRMLAGASVLGHDAENVWLVLAVAADAVEKTILYTAGAMPTEAMRQQAASEYAESKARLERVLALSLARHGEADKAADGAMGIVRNPSQ